MNDPDNREVAKTLFYSVSLCTFEKSIVLYIVVSSQMI